LTTAIFFNIVGLGGEKWGFVGQKLPDTPKNKLAANSKQGVQQVGGTYEKMSATRHPLKFPRQHAQG
jgi:hypothetical protein